MPETRFSTGNEFVSIPDVMTSSCGILDISFVYMLYRCVTELHGTLKEPFLAPAITIEKTPVDLSAAVWEHENDWIPSFKLEERGAEIKSRIFAPLDHRGFVWVIEVSSKAEAPLNIEIGWDGHWRHTNHVVNLSKPMRGEMMGSISSRVAEMPFVEFTGVAPIFAVAFHPSEPMQAAITSDRQPGRVITTPTDGQVVAGDGEGMRYSVSLPITLGPGESRTLALYVGLGLEELSAVTSAMDLDHHGWNTLYDELTSWLESHKLSVGDPKLDRTLNLNSFYNYYYSQAVTLDTEDLVLLTARSSNYHATAAYWDRDAMLWSLPAVLQIDPGQARKMLEYAFTTQLKNVGVHSRFIDGVVLEPGFELDELCSPIRALSMYVRATRDISILFDRRVQTGINRIRHLLSIKKNQNVALLETTLLPSDGRAMYPYVTYDNVLVWRVLNDLAWMYELIHDLDRCDENRHLAESVRKAIMEHCIVDGPFGPMFAWSVSLQGDYQLHDTPPGSLQLLSWLEFCSATLPAYENTVKWIHSEENPYSFHDKPFAEPGAGHDSHPFILSVANDLLTGRVDHAVDFIRRVEMDDGIACQSVDENTGKCTAIGAFATCAGYLAFALGTALGAKIFGPEPEPSDRLYEPPPPEIRASIESSRL